MPQLPEWIVKYWVEWLFGLIVAGFGWIIRRLSKKIKTEREAREQLARDADERQAALEDGMRALLRRQILADCEMAQDRGYCPAKVKETISVMFEAYSRLGGNGVVTPTVHQVIDELPIVDTKD